jgi:hypothetical protein
VPEVSATRGSSWTRSPRGSCAGEEIQVVFEMKEETAHTSKMSGLFWGSRDHPDGACYPGRRMWTCSFANPCLTFSLGVDLAKLRARGVVAAR